MRAASLDEECFRRILPFVDLDSIDFSDWSHGQPARSIAQLLKRSESYKEYLLEQARDRRELACRYLYQEIDPSEKHAFVEFWGQGYTQVCHERLWNISRGSQDSIAYYYVRSAKIASDSTDKNCIRYNMTTLDASFFHMEAVFANMPYHSVEDYRLVGNRVSPVLKPINYDKALYDDMQVLLPLYAKEYAKLDLRDHDGADRKLLEFLLLYYQQNKTDPFIFENFGSLVDAVGIFGRKREFAPPYTNDDINRFRDGGSRSENTMSIDISYARSSEQVKQRYNELYQIEGSGNVLGTYLNHEQFDQNQECKQLYSREVSIQQKYSKIYNELCAEHDVDNRITLITTTKSFGDVYISLTATLKKQTDFKVHRYSLIKDIQSIDEMMMSVAKSRFVFIDGNSPYFAGITFRPETKCCLLNTNPLRMYWWGHKYKHRQKWHKKLEEATWSTDFGMLEAASEDGAERLLRMYGLSPYTVNVFHGSSITDVYFDPHFKQRALDKLHKLFPESVGKKVLVYLPNLKTPNASTNWLPMIDLELLHSLIGDDYIVCASLYAENEQISKACNVIEVPGFSKTIRGEISLRSLLSIADVVAGSFRDILYETVLLDIPVFDTSTSKELSLRMRSSNFASDLALESPFPRASTAHEIYNAIINLDSYDFAPLNRFREKYFTYCDGKSAYRIVTDFLEVTKID